LLGGGSGFLGYNRADLRWRNGVLTHLSPWKVSIWDDSNIEPGDRWKAEIFRAISNSTAAVALVSPGYFALVIGLFWIGDCEPLNTLDPNCWLLRSRFARHLTSWG